MKLIVKIILLMLFPLASATVAEPLKPKPASEATIAALNKVVTAQPTHAEASALLADTFEQLGYQSEGPQ